MADSVTTKTLFSGTNEVVLKITNLSDGTGESGVKKLDITTLTGPLGVAPVHLSLVEVRGQCAGMVVKVFSNFGTNPTTWVIAAGRTSIDYRPYSGVVDAGTGTGNGSVMVTTNGQGLTGSSYDLTLVFRMLTA